MSFLDDLEAEAAIVRRSATKTIPVPPTGKMQVRLKPPADPDASSLVAVSAAYRRNGALTLDEACQLLVDCQDEIVDAQGGQYDPEGGPLRFDASDPRWGFDTGKGTALDCVKRLFHTDEQPLALAGIADAIVDWLQGVDAVVAEAIAGESGSAAAS